MDALWRGKCVHLPKTALRKLRPSMKAYDQSPVRAVHADGPRSASSANAALKLSEKFRRFVILVSIRSGWIHLSTLSEFARSLQCISATVTTTVTTIK
jgi:hypothetical protein